MKTIQKTLDSKELETLIVTLEMKKEGIRQGLLAAVAMESHFEIARAQAKMDLMNDVLRLLPYSTGINFDKVK